MATMDGRTQFGKAGVRLAFLLNQALAMPQLFLPEAALPCRIAGYPLEGKRPLFRASDSFASRGIVARDSTSQEIRQRRQNVLALPGLRT
jgi:hypothetical protein